MCIESIESYDKQLQLQYTISLTQCFSFMKKHTINLKILRLTHKLTIYPILFVTKLLQLIKNDKYTVLYTLKSVSHPACIA